VTQAMVGSGGFLFAVLWFDLMFDVQVAGFPGGPLPGEILASIAAYYHRVTTAADPMGKAVGLVMIFTVVGAALQLRNRALPPAFHVRLASHGCARNPLFSRHFLT
jgi:hypothetical protein